jgi:hypothetical protein
MARKALLVGLNAYRPPIHPLRGCINDAYQIKDILQDQYGFDPADIRLLLDEQATREAILTGLDWLVQGTLGGDVLVFHYSGHGSQVDDDSDDEWECRDEILVPYDHDWDTPLRDDDLKNRFSRVPLTANLTIISDSCHSGTVNKLFSANETPRTIFVPAEIQHRIATKVAKRDAEYRAFLVAEYRRMARELPPEELDAEIEQFLARALEKFKENRFQFVNTSENNILLAGCRDVQTSADALIDGDWHGAFTYNLAGAITDAGGALTYSELIARASEGMSHFQQVPQLECPEELRQLPVFSPMVD